MDTFRLSDTHFPLVVSVMPPRIDVPMMSEYVERIDAIYRRGERFATLVDTSRMEAIPTSADRAFLAEWQNRTVELITRHNVINVTVVQSVLMRGALSAMNWIFPPPNEQLVVADFDEGFRICLDRLRRESASLPAGLERLASLGRPIRGDDFPGTPEESGGRAVLTGQNAAATAASSATASSKSEKS
ncbi:MAG: hypothetical protein U0230_04540 [Polyangiales bacterium]